MGSVVDEYVDAAEIADRSLDNRPAMLRGPDVSFDQNDLSPLAFDQCCYFLDGVHDLQHKQPGCRRPRGQRRWRQPVLSRCLRP